MKKLLAILLCITSLLTLFGCAKTGNSIWKDASPGTSAMHFYRFDEAGGYGSITFDQTDEGKILDRLSAVDATPTADWTPEKVTLPVYGIEIGTKDGMGIRAAWSNGYLILRDGSVYEFDFNFSALEEDYTWEYSRAPVSLSAMPCGRLLSEGADGWVADRLSPAEELTPPDGITMVFKELTAGKITVKLSNTSETDWCFGEYFSLHVLLDGIWYRVPELDDKNYMFNDIGIILPAGESMEKSYSLGSYGTLPADTYRLVVEGMSVEFTRPYTDRSIACIYDETPCQELVDMEEVFFEDDNNKYIFGNPISQYIIVRYADGSEENIRVALENGRAIIGDLDRFGIHYWTEPKAEGEITCVWPPRLNLATLLDLVDCYGENLSWEHFDSYDRKYIGSGLYVLDYPIDEDFYLLIGGESKDAPPAFIRLHSRQDSSRYVEVRTDDIEGFLKEMP